METSILSSEKPLTVMLILVIWLRYNIPKRQIAWWMIMLILSRGLSIRGNKAAVEIKGVKHTNV